MSKRSQLLLERLRNLSGKDIDGQGLRRYTDFNRPDEFVNWEIVKWSSIDITAFENDEYPWNIGAIRNPISRPEIKKWCEENCLSRYISYRKNIYFEDVSDATVFIMRWC